MVYETRRSRNFALFIRLNASAFDEIVSKLLFGQAIYDDRFPATAITW